MAMRVCLFEFEALECLLWGLGIDRMETSVGGSHAHTHAHAQTHTITYFTTSLTLPSAIHQSLYNSMLAMQPQLLGAMERNESEKCM